MAITKIKIHPAIGIARVGNSPDEFFIGPELPGDRSAPPDGYKDNACRIKRQAARFRLFGYDDSDTLIQEITTADAEITWTVHLVNKKATSLKFAGSGNRNASITDPGQRQGLIIDPAPRTLTGSSQQQKFDTGTFTYPGKPPVIVPLGEIRTDTEGHLLVLGGFGKSASPTGKAINETFNNDECYDDVSDGPVTATVKLNGSAASLPVEGAWVIVAPPKYAPPVDNIITLYDRLFDLFVRNSLLSAPSQPSFTKDIYPIFKSTLDTRGVNQGASFAHSSLLPTSYPLPDAARLAIFNKLKKPGGGGGNMPDLKSYLDDGRLTDTQYKQMEQWKNGDFIDDWAGSPPPATTITPEGLDRAALENCVGGAFYPGIEAGAFLIEDITRYKKPFRLDSSKVNAGDVTAQMALPWQTDFYACNSNWWPAPRPNEVIPQGTSSYQGWARGVGDKAAMVNQWNTLGFVVAQGNDFVEVERCDTTYITLLTPSVNFQDVPQGPGGMPRKTARAIVFEVLSPGGAVTLEFKSGPSNPRLQRFGSTSMSVGPTSAIAPAKLRLWITYETGAVGEILTDKVSVRNPATGQEWEINIRANTVGAKKAAVAMVLDRSGSMDEDRGDGKKKIESLREAASIFVDVMLAEDGISLIRFDQDAQRLTPVTALGSASDPFDPGRSTTKNVLKSSQLDPAGSTSIGDGIFQGRQALNEVTGYDVKALVVLTDGKENQPAFIADVASSINAQTYAIGLGKPENISVSALQTISGNNGGYLLITGEITGDKSFVLTKYFLQILAGISNAEIVTDPQGILRPGTVHRIPFRLTEADTGIDVILLSPSPGLIDFRLQTPLGEIIDPAIASSSPIMSYVLSEGVSYYRLSLPVELQPDRLNQEGDWQAILSFQQQPDDDDIIRIRSVSAAQVQQAVPYSLIVHSYSGLRFRAIAQQKSFEPGSKALLSASLSEFDIPMEREARVFAEITRPDGSLAEITLSQAESGQFRGEYDTALQGVYQVRLRASGTSQLGWLFQREQTLTVPVWQGGDRESGKPLSDEEGHHLKCCQWVLLRLQEIITWLLHRQ